MSLPARDAEAAAGARVLAREASQDIWAQAPQPVSQGAETLGLLQRDAWWSARIHRTVRKHLRVQERSRSAYTE